MTIIGSAIRILLPFIIFGMPVLLGIVIDRIDYWQDVKKYGKDETDEIYRRWK